MCIRFVYYSCSTDTFNKFLLLLSLIFYLRMLAFCIRYIWFHTSQSQMMFNSHHTFSIYLFHWKWIGQCSYLKHIVFLKNQALCTARNLHNFHPPKPFGWLCHNHLCIWSLNHLVQKVWYKGHNLSRHLALLWLI